LEGKGIPLTQPESSPKRKLRVLIADDVQETRRNTRLMLAMIADVEVVAIANDGLQAVQLAKEQHPDVAVIDINMPRMDGITASKEIIDMYPDMGCIIMSSEKDTTNLQKVMSLGIQDYLVKPFTVEELEEAIKHVKIRIDEFHKGPAQAEQLPRKSEINLKQLAEEYARTRRTDDRAVYVFEKLAADPACDLYWLRTLAMVYIIRQDWGKLKYLAARLEQQTKNQHK
jgi:YesN/AraC family two-component response regulator